MKELLAGLFLWLCTPPFLKAQAEAPTSKFYEVDTVGMSSDTAFVIVKAFNEHHFMTSQWEMFHTPLQCTYHGRYTSWYDNGRKKSEGTYSRGKKNPDWIFWNKEGKETSSTGSDQQP